MSAYETEREHRVHQSSDRSFGLVFTAFFTIVGTLPLLRGGSIRPWALIAAGVFLVVSLLAPALLRPLNRLWGRLGLLLHKVTNPIILGFLFYVVFTPLGLIMRLMGKDLLQRRADPSAPSYWIPRNPPGPAPETMKNQF